MSSRSPAVTALALMAALFGTSAVAQTYQWERSPINGHLYALTPPLTWHDAEAAAQRAGGHLATFRTAAEHQWILQTFGGQHVWIGLNDEAQEGVFGWTSGEPFAFSAWCPGQPDASSPAEDYVHLAYYDPWCPDRWNDQEGDDRYPGLIEVQSQFQVDVVASGGFGEILGGTDRCIWVARNGSVWWTDGSTLLDTGISASATARQEGQSLFLIGSGISEIDEAGAVRAANVVIPTGDFTWRNGRPIVWWVDTPSPGCLEAVAGEELGTNGIWRPWRNDWCPGPSERLSGVVSLSDRYLLIVDDWSWTVTDAIDIVRDHSVGLTFTGLAHLNAGTRFAGGYAHCGEAPPNMADAAAFWYQDGGWGLVELPKAWGWGRCNFSVMTNALGQAFAMNGNEAALLPPSWTGERGLVPTVLVPGSAEPLLIGSEVWVMDQQQVWCNGVPRIRAFGPSDFLGEIGSAQYWAAQDRLLKTTSCASESVLGSGWTSIGSEFESVPGGFLFIADDRHWGSEPWFCDANTDAVYPVADIVPGPAGSNPITIRRMRNDVFLVAGSPGARDLIRLRRPRARVLAFGEGCAGSNGTPRLVTAAGSRPVLGTTISLDASSIATSPLTAAFGLLGFSDRAGPGALPLPLDLSPVGMPGCLLLTSSDDVTSLLARAGTATWSIRLPSDPALSGVEVFAQVVSSDPSANPLGAVTSNGLGLRLGL